VFGGLPHRRELLLLAAGMAALYGMVELAFGVAALTFEDTGGSDSLEGLPGAILLGAGSASAVPAGRAMDRFGRRPVLLGGFAAGLAGCLLTALAVSTGSLALALVGFVLAGVATGTVLLSRAAAAGLVPAEWRPRAIAVVLFGAVFGALLGPLVFGPLLGEDDTSSLDLAWLGGAGFMLVGALVALQLQRNDPAAVPVPGAAATATGRPLREIVTRPGVPMILAASLASWAGMVTAMSLVGGALIDHGHEHNAVFPVLAAHFVGMFAFFAVVGPAIERLGRLRSIAIGLLVMAASSALLPATIETVHLAGLALFGVGLGWSLSFVAATSELSDRAEPGDRATLIGFGDMLGGGTGALSVVAGGLALDAFGVAALGIGGAMLPLTVALVVVLAPGGVRSARVA
jgi:MFS family permease